MFSYFIIFCKLFVSLVVPCSSYKPNYVLLLNKISQVHHCTGLPQYTDLSSSGKYPPSVVCENAQVLVFPATPRCPAICIGKEGKTNNRYSVSKRKALM